MPRFINPNPQFSDKNGSPLAFGAITFYESGTTTFKTTYSDPGLTVPNDNPVPLDAAGRAQTDIFYEGDANVVLKDSNGVVQWQDDPVSSGNSSSFPDWNAGTSYQIDDIVKYEGDFYRAIAPSTNEVPTNQQFWSKILQTEEWNSNDTYNTDSLVVRNGIHYISLIDGNTSDPETTSDEWRASSSATVIYTDEGTSSEYIVNPASGFSGQKLEDGLILSFVASNSSALGATLDFNNNGSKDILNESQNPIFEDDITNGMLTTLVYDSALDAFVLSDPSVNSEVRLSLIENPLMRLFNKNNQSPVISGSLSTLRASDGTFIDRYGFLKTVSSNVVREEKEGFLIETESTNILTYSEELNNSSWTKVGSSVSLNDITAPDKTVTADKIIEDNSLDSRHGVFYTTSVTTGDTYTLSFFAKADTRTEIRIAVGSSAVIPIGAYFDIENGIVLSTILNCTAEIEELSDGWYRCSATATAISSSSTAFWCRLSVNQNDEYDGDGVSGAYVWGAQFEQASSSSSYIKTVATTASRSEDDYSVDYDNNFNFNSPFSFYAQINLKRPPSSQASRIFANSGTSAPELRLQSNGAIGYIDNGGTYNSSESIIQKGVQSIAIVYDGSRLKFYYNGDLVTSLNFSPVNADPITTIKIGEAANADLGFNGNILDFRSYDFALNNNEIRLISS